MRRLQGLWLDPALQELQAELNDDILIHSAQFLPSWLHLPRTAATQFCQVCCTFFGACRGGRVCGDANVGHQLDEFQSAVCC